MSDTRQFSDVQAALFDVDEAPSLPRGQPQPSYIRDHRARLRERFHWLGIVGRC